MLQYFTSDRTIGIELTVLTGGEPLTGRTPTCAIRDKLTNNYFDFSSRVFTSTTVSATALLTSSVDGLYAFSWSIEGLFNSNRSLTFEYNDATAFAVDDVRIVTEPTNFAGGSVIEVKGLWTKEQKRKIIDDVEDTKDLLGEFRKNTFVFLRKILGGKK